jgi:hypothetical protein
VTHRRRRLELRTAQRLPHRGVRSNRDTDMSEPRYPSESQEYRAAREALLKDEQELINKVCGETPSAASRRTTQGRLCLPVGNRGESRQAREVLGAVWRQEFSDALLVDVRPQLGRTLSFLHVADGWF